ncbi:hypothetical protein NDU88_004384 [Pleurodeles waltl]|uniref:Uncharacterized protein n=1 Tax=Pleurodeles waltl TaxID=8319 RepID=A0AAV7TRB5_PLEWA|nr:hypothetical protein NDU88_004384 [Pleurodeles waltl]
MESTETRSPSLWNPEGSVDCQTWHSLSWPGLQGAALPSGKEGRDTALVAAGPPPRGREAGSLRQAAKNTARAALFPVRRHHCTMLTTIPLLHLWCCGGESAQTACCPKSGAVTSPRRERWGWCSGPALETVAQGSCGGKSAAVRPLLSTCDMQQRCCRERAAQ